jgi:flagellar motor component MotA
MIRTVLLLSVIGVGIALGADSSDFAEFDDVVNNADETAKKTIGVFGTWLIGMLPVLGLVIGIFGGLKFLKKRSNGQEENFAKELGFAAGGAFLGLIVAFIFITAVGAGLMGDSNQAFTVLNNFWKGIFGVSTT